MSQIHSDSVITNFSDPYQKKIKYYSCSDCHLALLDESENLEMRQGLKLCLSISFFITIITIILLFMLPKEWQKNQFAYRK